MGTWAGLSCVALVLWGITGVTQKLSTNKISSTHSFVWFSVAFALVAAGLLAFVPLGQLSVATIALAALGGLLNGGGALTSFAAFERGGKASIVIPLVSLYPLVTIGGAWLFLDERVTAIQAVGIACALVAVLLLSRESGPEEAVR
jgi:bacterial/archaeal transporter family protein